VAPRRSAELAADFASMKPARSWSSSCPHRFDECVGVQGALVSRLHGSEERLSGQPLALADDHDVRDALAVGVAEVRLDATPPHVELHVEVGAAQAGRDRGGRYDDLVRALGVHDPIPACGFSFGLERLKLALDAEGQALLGDKVVDVLVAPVEEADEGPAAAIATRLRGAGLDVELDVRRRGVKMNLRHADREGIPYVVIVGERERLTGQPILRDMQSRHERALDAEALAATLVEAVRAGR